MNQEHNYYYMTPEHEAMKLVLERTSTMQKLSVDLLRQEKLTQTFFKRFYTEILEAYFDVEQCAVDAMKKNRDYAGQILDLEGRVRNMELRLIAMDVKF